MLNYKLLDRKPKITKNGESYVDLLTKTFDDDATFIPAPLIVNKYYVARPDLISFAVYGDDKYADVICKINGISNPFELNEDDILNIPNEQYLQSFVINNAKKSELIENPKNDTIQKKDIYNKQKRKNERRTPNEQVIGDSNFIIDKSLGIVFY